MGTLKFRANGAELEADYTLLLVSGSGDFLFRVDDVRCEGESLDPEELAHLRETNPQIVEQLAQLAILEDGHVGRH